MFDLMLSDRSVVTRQGRDGEEAARRYVDCHREATVIAWRTARRVLIRGCVIDGRPAGGIGVRSALCRRWSRMRRSQVNALSIVVTGLAAQVDALRGT